jgi:hypothetical protein
LIEESANVEKSCKLEASANPAIFTNLGSELLLGFDPRGIMGRKKFSDATLA